MSGAPLLTLRNLRVVYPGDDGDFRAVRNVSFSLGRERLGIGAVAGDPAVVVSVQTCQLGEHPSIAGVGLGARGRQPFPVARRRQRVHRDDLVAGGNQRPDEQAAVCLGRHHHLTGLLDVSGDELVEPADALDALRQAEHHLQEAKHDKGGHRAKALADTRDAIKHVEEGMKFADKH